MPTENRNTGRTTRMLNWARKAEAAGETIIIVAHSSQYARMLADQVGPRTKSVSITDPVRMVGLSAIPFVDHHALEAVNSELDSLRRDLDISETRRKNCEIDLAEARTRADDAERARVASGIARADLMREVEEAEERAVAVEQKRERVIADLEERAAAVERKTERVIADLEAKYELALKDWSERAVKSEAREDAIAKVIEGVEAERDAAVRSRVACRDKAEARYEAIESALADIEAKADAADSRSDEWAELGLAQANAYHYAIERIRKAMQP